jgi:hypothetical protein
MLLNGHFLDASNVDLFSILDRVRKEVRLGSRGACQVYQPCDPAACLLHPVGAVDCNGHHHSGSTLPRQFV